MPKKTKKTKKTTQKQRQKQSVNVKIHIDQSKRTVPRNKTNKVQPYIPAHNIQSSFYPSTYNVPLPLVDNSAKTENLATTNQLINALVTKTTSPQFDYDSFFTYMKNRESNQRSQNNVNPSNISFPTEDDNIPSQFVELRQLTNTGLTAEASGMTSNGSLDDDVDDAEKQLKSIGLESSQATVENGFKKLPKNVIFADSDSEPEKVDLETAANVNPKKTVGRPRKEKPEKPPSTATPAQIEAAAKAREGKKRKKYGNVTVEDVDEGYETGY